jgi:hypothetical protein
LAKGARLFLQRLSREPPFRLFSQKVVKYFSRSIRTKAKWDVVDRPHYLLGLLRAADEAAHESVPEILAIEFGVAAGDGLVTLQKYAAEVEKETGVRIRVFGFDTGKGLPSTSGDYRDHCDHWRGCDYPMDEQALRARLAPTTELIMGDVAKTVPRFMEKNHIPIGFVAFDLDLYSSTRDALLVFSHPRRKMLRRAIAYFDDINFFIYHGFAGELLAIKEFNEQCSDVPLDRWRGIRHARVFFEDSWLSQMYVAHDLTQISRVELSRAPRRSVAD